MAVEAPSLVKYEGLGVTTPEEILKREHPRFYKKADLVNPELVPADDLHPLEKFQAPRAVTRYLLNFRDRKGHLDHIAVPDAISPSILRAFVTTIPSQREEDRIYFQNQVLVSSSALDLILRLNFGLIYVEAMRRRTAIRGSILTFNDLLNAGRMGMVRSTEKFDLNARHKGRAIQFSTFATRGIASAIDRLIGNERNLIQVPTHIQERVGQAKEIHSCLSQQFGRTPTREEYKEALEDAGIKGVKLEFILAHPAGAVHMTSLDTEDSREQSMYDKIENGEADIIDPQRDEERDWAREFLYQALDSLSPQEAQLLILREGLFGGEKYSHRQIAKLLSIPYEKILLMSKLATQNLHSILYSQKPQNWNR